MHSEGNYQENEKATYRLREDICKLYIFLRENICKLYIYIERERNTEKEREKLTSKIYKLYIQFNIKKQTNKQPD